MKGHVRQIVTLQHYIASIKLGEPSRIEKGEQFRAPSEDEDFFLKARASNDGQQRPIFSSRPKKGKGFRAKRFVNICPIAV